MGMIQRIQCCCIHERQPRFNFWFLRFCCVGQWCHGGQLDVSGKDSFNNSHVHLLQKLWFVKGPAWLRVGFQQQLSQGYSRLDCALTIRA